MDSSFSQDSTRGLMVPPVTSGPTTPELSHVPLPAGASKPLSSMTPPPSTQLPSSSSHVKTRTPTPAASHISTPPPTIELAGQSQSSRMSSGISGLEHASSEQLKAKIAELQTSCREANMSAAHHKLQYQMLAQESAAAIERLAVEARMAQSENEVLYHAEHTKTVATPVSSTTQAGFMPIEKELYHRMCREIQLLGEANQGLDAECRRQNRIIEHQETEIASLSDKVTLMRERIRESREHMHKLRRVQAPVQMDATPRSAYNTPHRGPARSHQQPQRFEALLQASEIASQESARAGPPGRKGHQRNIHSMSSLPSTPHRMPPPSYHTPHGRQAPARMPATAPMPRIPGALRTPDIYNHQSLPVPHEEGPQSDGTVSASDNEDDSEAETDIIEPEDDVGESFASRAATQMLRPTKEQAKRDSFKGSGMLQSNPERPLKQTKLFGAVRKANVDRVDERPAKRPRADDIQEPAPVGLGIAGVRH
ncbi:uncharacterized protein RCC_01776 [Ramularia collo-cygni]|uniref:FAD-dependent oxidoreductase-like enzyme n=1 Tax=Ramularia collo-cygni TaxID=112498 RepID=A0A2D3UV49_9PEZI|nr:uncharacterized protein RCC_01776 [Ramularia collo-cygni]CZT15937.1 uncharacterized protein RCC_01776 [Ramularia collo-cygni]